MNIRVEALWSNEVFELSGKRMSSACYRASRNAVKKMFLSRRNHRSFLQYSIFSGFHNAWTNGEKAHVVFRENGSVRIGCQSFSSSDARKLRKWALDIE